MGIWRNVVFDYLYYHSGAHNSWRKMLVDRGAKPHVAMLLLVVVTLKHAT